MGRLGRTIHDMSEYLGVSQRTLSSWRRRGIGPPFVKTGGIVRYPEEETEQWIERNMSLSDDNPEE